MNVHFALCITSCDRFGMLKASLDSLIQTLTIKPRMTFICEDSDKPRPEWLDNSYESSLSKITWLSNGTRRGQVFSIDRLIEAIPRDIERVLWLEDDWSWTGSGYINEGLRILDECPDICQVVFRKEWPHPLVDDPKGRGFQIAQPRWRGTWGGWTWNPHVTRTSDLKRYGSYASQAGYVSGLKHEEVFSKKFLDAGYRIAALPKYCYHTGNDCSRSADGWTPEVQKILIAIPACHSLSYGKWEGDHTNECDAKDFHFSGPNERIQAIRDTWLHDVVKFPNVTYKLFYGGNGGRQPLADEIFLDVADDYEHLPDKTIAICKYAKANNYDLVLKADDDSLLIMDRIIQEGIGIPGEYGGYVNGHMCTGGTGYWLTRKAFTIIADTASSKGFWAEDWCVASYMRQQNIHPIHFQGHYTGREQHWFWPENFDPATLPEGASAIHAVQPRVMRQWWAWRNGWKEWSQGGVSLI